MKRRLIAIISTAILTVSLIGCGSSSTTTEVDLNDAKENLTKTNTEENEADNVAEEDITSSVDAPVLQDEEETELSSEDKFDVNKQYAPSDEILNATLEDGVFIQIGDSVLKLGEVTLRDFVNAGIDLGDVTDEKSDNKNEYYMESTGEGHVMLGSIGEEVQVRLSLVKQEGTPAGDAIIDTISFYVSDLNINGGGYMWTNGYNEYAEQYINGGNVKDLYSIYFTGGIRFTGSPNEISDKLASPAVQVQYDDRGYNALGLAYRYPENIPIRSNCSLYFGNDKCCYAELYTHVD